MDWNAKLDFTRGSEENELRPTTQKQPLPSVATCQMALGDHRILSQLHGGE